MSDRLGAALHAELIKIATLPVAVLTIVATGAGSVVLAAAIAVQPVRDPGLPWVQFAQIGFLLLGCLTSASEQVGGQIRTSLTAVPRRLRLLGAKVLAYLITALGMAAVTVAGAASVMPASPGRLLGAAAYLSAIGLLGLGVGVITRNLVGAFAGTLAALLMVSPLLDGLPDLARYLPDQAGAALFQPAALDPTGLDPAVGGAVVLAWVAVVLAAAGARFVLSDA